jgi:acetyl-CoA acetyltransferase
MSNDPVIVGVAESDLGVTGKSILQLIAQASLKAVAEAGLTLDDVDGIATAGVARFSASAAAEYLGIAPTWMDSTFEGGSSFELQLNRAVEAIRTGSAEVVLIAYGSNQRSASLRTLGGVTFPHTPEAQFEVPFGPLNPISMYALAAQRHMHEFGTRPEDLAEIAVAARAWALLNPAAYRYGAGPLTIDDVLGSPMISTPLHRLDCCLVTDGGGAVVVTGRDRARDLATSPISVLGYGETTTHVAMSQMPDLTSTGAVTSGARAFAMAGLRPEDVDVVEVYDSFTITTLLTLEALGFADRGEGAALVADGGIAPGGRLPVNTSGGGLSYCHPGMFGIFLLIEAVRQLRGEGGARQVEGAEVALVHGTGGILTTHATVILGSDR